MTNAVKQYRIWTVTVSCLDPADNYSTKVKASSEEEAISIIESELKHTQIITSIKPTRRMPKDK